MTSIQNIFNNTEEKITRGFNVYKNKYNLKAPESSSLFTKTIIIALCVSVHGSAHGNNFNDFENDLLYSIISFYIRYQEENELDYTFTLSENSFLELVSISCSFYPTNSGRSQSETKNQLATLLSNF